MTLREYPRKNATFEKAMSIEETNPPLSDALYVLTKLRRLLEEVEGHVVCKPCSAGLTVQLALDKKDTLTLKELSR